MTGPVFEYDVCLSFASEQRQYVERVANSLKSSQVRVFYDLNEQATLWGKDLYEHLDEIYRKKARYCIIFISQDYVRKVWTNHERKSAQARAIELGSEYILPARFDDTDVPGIRSTVGYIDLNVISPEDLAALTLQKISNSTAEGTTAPVLRIQYSTAPITQAQQDHLIALSPDGWEFFLFAGVLLQGKARLQHKRRDYELGYARQVRTIDDDFAAIDFISACMSRTDAIIQNLTKVLDPRAHEWAFGAPGTPGNADNIIHLGNRFVDSYEDFMDWAADIRGTLTSDNMKNLYRISALYADSPIRRIEKFMDDFAEKTSSVPGKLEAGEHVDLSMTLMLDIAEDAMGQFSTEMKRLRRTMKR